MTSLVRPTHLGRFHTARLCLLGSWGMLIGLGCGPGLPVINWAELSRPSEFRLGGGDKLHIEVQDHPELTRDVVVRPDGMISLPMVGEISARDRLPAEVAADITRQIDRFIKNTVITVSVAEVNSYTIFVLGEVNKPGDFRASEPRTVMQALALAGGLTPFASPSRIQVLRKRIGQTDQVIPIHYGDIVSGDAPEQNILLLSGDTVVVP